MKKLVIYSTLVGILAFSTPVMAASPTAPAAAAQTQQASTAGTLTSSQQTQASQLVASGAVSSQAAANAVVSSLANVASAETVSSDKYDAQFSAVYNNMSEAEKAAVDKAAAERNMSSEEVVGNYVKPDAEFEAGAMFTWNPTQSQTVIDGKAGSAELVLSRPDDATKKAILGKVKEAAPNGKVMGVLNIGVKGKANTIDTTLSCSGVTDKDSVNSIKAYQYVGGKLVEVKVTGVSKGAVSVHLAGKGPVTFVRG